MIASRTTDFRLSKEDGKSNRGKIPWKFSLKATSKEDKIQNESILKTRRLAGKENNLKSDQTSKNLKSNSTGDKKSASKMSKIPSTKTSSSESGKEEIAKKAKTRFLENLYKFQKGSKPSGFESARNAQSYRSYRKQPSSINEQQNSSFNNGNSNSFRRSFRTTSVSHMKSVQNPIPPGQSNRELIAERIAKLENKATVDESLATTGFTRVERASRGSMRTNLKKEEDNFEYIPSRNKELGSRSQLSSTSSTNTMTSESSQPRVAMERKQSRAELAMERHKERMRKSSQTTSPVPKSFSSGRSSMAPNNKLRKQSNGDKGNIPTQTRFAPQQSNSALPPVAASRQNKSNGKSTKKSARANQTSVTSPSYKCINIIEDNVFEPQVLSTPIKTQGESIAPNTFDDSLYLTPAGTNQRTANGSNHLSAVNKAIPILFATPSADQEIPSSAYFTSTGDLQRGFDFEVTKENSDYDKVEAKPEILILDLPPKAQKKSLKKKKSPEIESSINYSAEEAIDTFRRLSEEIDTIKTRGFRQSLVENSKKSDTKLPSTFSEALPKVLETESEVIQISTTGKADYDTNDILRIKGKKSKDKFKTIDDNIVNEPLSEKKATVVRPGPGSSSKQKYVSAKSGSFVSGSTSQANADNERGEERNKEGILANSVRLLSNDSDTVFTVNSAVSRTETENITYQRVKNQTSESLDKPALDENSPVTFPNKKASRSQTESRATDSKIKNTASSYQEYNSPQSTKMSISVGSSFRQMPLEERRKRLRIAAQKYANDSSTDDNESVLSEGDSSDSDVDPSWLDSVDYGVKSAKASQSKKNNSVASSEKKTPTYSSQNGVSAHSTAEQKSQAVDIGGMKSMWETKYDEKVDYTNKPNDLDVIPKKIAEKMVERSLSPNPAKEQGLERKESVKVGSMLSMWENRKVEKKKGYDATDDEAFHEKTMGRLQGAKALFQNMAKSGSTSNGADESSSKHEANGHTTPPTSRDINQTKSMFENLTRSQSTRASSSPTKPIDRKASASVKHTTTPSKRKAVATEVKRATVRRPSSVYSSSEYDSDEATLSSESSSEDEQQTKNVTSAKSMWEKKASQKYNNEKSSPKPSLENLLQSDSQSGDDIRPGDATGNISDVKNAWEEKASKRGTDKELSENKYSEEEAKTEQIENIVEPEVKMTSPYSKGPHIQRKSTGKSNIQSKISARKKRGRRSMTQPITGEDVNSAKELILDQKTPVSENESDRKEGTEGEEEKTLSFSDRLTFFNKLCKQVPVSPVKRFPQRSRGSNKRFNTQPVDINAVQEAKLKFGKDSDKIKTLFDKPPIPPVLNTIESSPKKSTNLLPAITPTLLSVNSVDYSRSNSQSSEEGRRKSLPEDSDKDQEKEEPRKIGKLPSSLLNFNFLEASPKSVKPKTPPSPRRKLRSPNHLVDEKENNFDSDDSGEMGRETVIKSTGSIQDRLRQLHNNNDGWKKNVSSETKPIRSTLGDRVNQLQENGEKWKDDKSTDKDLSKIQTSAANKSNINDRLNSILANSTSWKSKTGKQNDAEQFTVQGKRSKREGSKMLPILSSPSLKRRVLPVLPTKEEGVSANDVTEQEGHGLSKLSEIMKLSRKGLESDVVKNEEKGTTLVPEMVDDDFKEFFSATTINIDHIQTTETVANDKQTDVLTSENDIPTWWKNNEFEVGTHRLSDLGHLKAGVQRQSTRRKRSSRNPVKALAAREDVKRSYTEHRSNIGTLEQKRMATRFGGGNFTSAALAGLATKADFSKVSLRNTKKTQAFSASDLQPWQDKMLLRVKGRRKVQTRLVEPSSKSLNSGDAFLLILPDSLFAWFGEFCNIIEKAKVQEIADYIIHQGDMGSKANSLYIIEEHNSSSSRAKEFWEHLNGKSEFAPSGGCEEDELFEVNSKATTKTYKMVDAKLVPHEPAWGKLPTMAMLDTNDTYVFDFGAEMYIWQGKEVSFENRQLAVKMARALWDQGYDYSSAEFCPFVSTSEMTTNLKGARPSWGLFARVNENLETALVQEKFEDWSNIYREIGEREQNLRESSRGDVASEMNLKTSIKPDLTACDVCKMHNVKVAAVPLKLEGHSILRGHGHMFDNDGRGLHVVTSSVQTWHATDKDKKLLESSDSKGVFYRGETYVVQWKYIVSSTGKWSATKAAENLKKIEPKGRERTAYFLWAGSDSTVNEKGASAIMATEIDKEGAQIILCQGKDPPALRQCFNGSMIVVDGKQDNREGFYSWKLYSVSGDYQEEATLYQVPCDSQSLRSKASFIAMNGRLAKVVVWHGCKSIKLQRELAESAAKNLQERKQLCMGFRRTCSSVEISICEEGEENNEFLDGVGRVRRTKYVSLLENAADHPAVQTRAWHLSPSNDQFLALEIHPVSQYENDDGVVLPAVFPILQEQLYDLPQPALALLENDHCVYVWQSECEEDLKGSAKRQLDINKRLSMETAVKYCEEYRKDCTPMFVHQNHEPLEFTNSFLIWRFTKQKISYEEKRSKKPSAIPKILETLSRLVYTLEELRATPLPEGVDPNHLETYLSAEDFENLFEMTKKQFYELAPWKQNNIRKEKNFF